MSANLKIASFSAAVLPYKIVSDTSLTAVPLIDVVQGSGTLRDITLDLSTGINHNYFLSQRQSQSDLPHQT